MACGIQKAELIYLYCPKFRCRINLRALWLNGLATIKLASFAVSNIALIVSVRLGTNCLLYRTPKGTKACVPIRRLKKYYSPQEEFFLVNNRISIPQVTSRSQYQLFRWRGTSFAIYNCYELVSIEDRGIFKGKVDFIICSEFNRDVIYFSNIVASAARDLHCFVLQVNSSQFGDSRVVSPSKTEKLNPLRIKGGTNQTFLTMELPLQKLREHQFKRYPLQKDSEEYKPTPPDFPIKDLLVRMNLGNR
jgi:hypothetical protein